MTDVADYARVLADAVAAALPGWVARCVDTVHGAWTGEATPAELLEEAARAGRRARDSVGAQVRVLLDADIDDQHTTPLALLRTAVAYPTEVLEAAGVPPVERDAYDVELFPEDRYGLTPASFADIDAGLQQPGLAWGAAKAWSHRQRHGAVNP